MNDSWRPRTRDTAAAMTRLWDKGTPLDARVLGFTAGDDYVLDNRLVRYDIQASIAHADMLAASGAVVGAGPELDPRGPDGHRRGTCARELGASRSNRRIARRRSRICSPRASARPAGACMPAVRATIRCSPRCACTCAMPRKNCGAARRRWRTALDALGARHGAMVLPGYTHMQQAMPSSVALWAEGFAAEIRDDAEGLELTQRRIGKNPLGSAAGYGTPHLELSREETRRRLGFSVTQEPVTAVQLSRGKAEAQLLFEITLLAQDMGRLAADLMLFYTQEFGFVTLPAAFTTGSSIMPQKRNPDVFELVRGRSAVAHAALNEVLGITQKLTSGYHRDLQLIKPPLFRGIDSCLQTLGHTAERARRRALPAGEHPARSRHPRRRRRERVGGQGRHSVSRGLSAGGRQAQGFRMTIWQSLPIGDGIEFRPVTERWSSISASSSPKSAMISFAAPCPSTGGPASPTDCCTAALRWRSPKPSEALGATMCVDTAGIPVRGSGDQCQSRAAGAHGTGHRHCASRAPGRAHARSGPSTSSMRRVNWSVRRA